MAWKQLAQFLSACNLYMNRHSSKSSLREPGKGGALLLCWPQWTQGGLINLTTTKSTFHNQRWTWNCKVCIYEFPNRGKKGSLPINSTLEKFRITSHMRLWVTRSTPTQSAGPKGFPQRLKVLHTQGQTDSVNTHTKWHFIRDIPIRTYYSLGMSDHPEVHFDRGSLNFPPLVDQRI